MNSNRSTPRQQQQQPVRHSSMQQQQQQQSGSSDFQPQAAGQQMGEGSYEGTRDYNQRTAEYLKTHDVKKDAEAAKPQSQEEAKDMERAEEEGKSHSKGER
jgi:hypothetical protein